MSRDTGVVRDSPAVRLYAPSQRQDFHFADHDDPAERRHLLRLSLTAHAFASVEDTLRSGISARQQDRYPAGAASTAAIRSSAAGTSR